MNSYKDKDKLQFSYDSSEGLGPAWCFTPRDAPTVTASVVEFKARYTQMCFPSSLYGIGMSPISHMSLWAHLLMWHFSLSMKDVASYVASYVAL